MDVFAIAATRHDVFDHVCSLIDKHLRQPMKCVGLLKHCNGIDILQTRLYITISVQTYMTKVLIVMAGNP